jgi:hypothetical protein
MVIRFYLKTATPGGATVTITNAVGQEVSRQQLSAVPGINQVVWNARLGGGGRGGRGGGGAPAGGPVSANPIDQWAPLGDYTVRLTVGGKSLSQKATIAKTQGWSIGATPQIIR